MIIDEEYFTNLVAHSAHLSKVTPVKMMSKSRNQFVVEARNMCFNILREHTNEYALEGIGKAFNRDHATVIHGIKKHDIAYARNGYYTDNYDDLVLLMAGNTIYKEVADVTFAEKNRLRINNLEEEKGRLKEQLYDIKKSTKLLLRSIKETQSLTRRLEKSCN
jgi:hypothetical protein